MRLVVVFCLACGTVLDAALGRYQGKQLGENSLLRTIADVLEPDDQDVAAEKEPGFPGAGDDLDVFGWQVVDRQLHGIGRHGLRDAADSADKDSSNLRKGQGQHHGFRQ
jgi:hypothetical protein